MDDVFLASGGIPTSVYLPTLFLYIIFAGLMVTRSRGASTRFLLFAIAARLILSSMPQYSFATSPVGVSWNAIGSIVIVGIGTWTLRRSAALRLIMPPVALVILCVLLSALINGDVGGSLETIVKYAYFAVVALAMFDACGQNGMAAVAVRLLGSFSLAYVLQFESLLLGVAKAGESDGSASYIGGFYHEAAFSVVLMTGMLVAALNPRMRVRNQLLVIAISVVGILLANYRTAIVAIAPLLVGVLIVAACRAVVARQRGIASTMVMLAIFASVPAVIAASDNRFDTLSGLIHNPQVLTLAPEEFSADDRKLLSGRVYFWSEYVAGWREGDEIHRLVGFGANAWEDRFGIYAHNTLVSTLYEFGLFGVAAMLSLWGWMLLLAFRTPSGHRLPLVLGHIGFIFLNMATMPFWLIEGLIFYGILCGATVHVHLRHRAAVDPRAPLRTVSPNASPR